MMDYLKKLLVCAQKHPQILIGTAFAALGSFTAVSFGLRGYSIRKVEGPSMLPTLNSGYLVILIRRELLFVPKITRFHSKLLYFKEKFIYSLLQ